MIKKLIDLIKYGLFRNFFIFSFIISLFVVFVSESILEKYYYMNHSSFHLMLEIGIIFFALAIFVQTWIITRFDRSKKMILFGYLFLIMGIVEGIHAITYGDMPYFFREANLNDSVWLSIISNMVLAFGFIVIELFKDKEVTNFYRLASFIIAWILIFCIVYLVLHPITTFPILFMENGKPNTLKIALHLITICAQIIALLIYLKDINWSKKNNIIYIISLIYYTLAEVVLILSQEYYDKFILLSHLISFLAFASLFFSFYTMRITEPLEDLQKTNKILKEAEAKVSKIAYYDEITALPNMKLLKENLNDYLGKNPRNLALVIFEMEQYDTLKSSLGQEIADQLNLLVSYKLNYNRIPDSTLYKIADNQFGLVIERAEYQENLENIILDMQNEFKKPITLNDFYIPISIFAGVSIYPIDASDEEELIQHALFAVYEARQTGHFLEIYELDMHKKQEKKILLETDLSLALDNQLYLEYQPQLDLSNNEINSLEALIRWKHPEKGIISPLDFIPIAEKTGLIIPIGEWILKTACLQTVELRNKTGIDFTVAVNLSMKQCYQKNFTKVVKKILEETKLPPENLQLEITESMTVNREEIVPLLTELKNLGIHIAIDDFGTGYSSLSYIKDFPLDVLKIDRSFVTNLMENKKNELLVKMIVSLAKHLELKVVAEGIETKEQLDVLSDLQCDKIQGYLISKPTSMDQIVKLINNKRK